MLSNSDKLPPLPKSPCAKDCPRRAWDCHSSKCDEWMAYYAAKEEWRRLRNEAAEAAVLTYDHIADFRDRFRKRRRK